MPKLKSIGVKLDLSDLKKLKQIAQQEQRSIGFLIGQAVKLYLEAKEPELDRRDR